MKYKKMKEMKDTIQSEINFEIAHKNIENMQKAIIDKHPSAIQYMDASYEVVKYAVQKWGYSIRYINNPTEELQLMAVRYNGYLLDDIEEPTPAVIYEAVLHCPIGSDSLKKYLSMLRSQCDDWDSIVWKLVNARPEIIFYIEPSIELIIHAIKITNNVCHIMQHLKLEDSYFSEDEIIKIYITAVYRDKNSICFIPNKYRDILIDTFGPEYFEPECKQEHSETNSETEKEE